MRLSPALFVGFGGTGHTVMIKLKRRLAAVLAEHRKTGTPEHAIPGCFQFLVVDLDRNRPPDLADDDPVFSNEADFPRLESPTISAITTGVKRRTERYQPLAPWWPEKLSEVFRERSTKRDLDQAYQNRLLGRAALFLHAENVFSGLIKKINMASNAATPAEVVRDYEGLEIHGGLSVNVVSSVAGGTGCGMFLDGVALIREAVRSCRVGNQPVNLFLFLPDLFSDVQYQPGANPEIPPANTYGALKELDHYLCRNEPFQVAYSPKLSVTVPDLADFVYLVGGRNEARQAVGTRAQLAELTAGFILALSAGLEGVLNAGQGRAARFAGRHDIGGGGRGVSKAYSSFGHHSVVYPRALMGEYAALTLKQALASSLTNGGDEESTLQEIRRTLDGDQLTGARPFWSLEPGLLPDVSGPTLAFLAQSSLTFQTTKRQHVPDVVGSEYRKAVRAIEQHKAKSRPRCLFTDPDDRLARQAIGTHLQRIVESPALGVPGARLFLEELKARVTASRMQCGTKATGFKSQRMSQSTLQVAERNFSSAADARFWFSREPVIKTHLAHLQADVAAFAQQTRFELLQDACHALLERIVEPQLAAIEQLLGEMRNLVQTCKIRRKEISEEVLRRSGDQTLVGCGPADRRAVDEQVEVAVPQKEPVVRSHVAAELALPSGFDADIERWVEELPFSRTSLLDIVGCQEQFVDWLTRQSASAVPFWTYNAREHGGGLPQSFAVSRFDEHTIWPFLGGAVAPLVFATIDVASRDEMAFVSVRDAAPIEAVDGATDWFKSYVTVDRGRPPAERWPCTVLPGAEAWQDLLPPDAAGVDSDALIRACECIGILKKSGKTGGRVALRVAQRTRTFASVPKIRHAFRTDPVLLAATRDAVVQYCLNLGSQGFREWVHQHEGALPADLERIVRSRFGLA